MVEANRARVIDDMGEPRMGSSADTDVNDTRIEYWLVLVCFFLSGWAALVYQTVWMRQFAVVFGTSELAIATVLGAYMAGLALGATLAGRFVKRIRRPVRVYGLLEIGIAGGALFVPTGMMLARGLQTMLIGGQPLLPDAGGLAQPLFYASIAFVLLLIPTTCMGATLPMLTRYVVHRTDQIGCRVGALYSVNTFGAVSGTLMAGFLILPTIGLWETTCLAVLANVLVLGIALHLERRRSGLVEFEPEPNAKQSSDAGPVYEWILPLMLVSGVVSFTYEVMWSRLLGHLIGGSVYAFSTMLAAFLTGIALGSGMASRIAWGRRKAIWGFVTCQLGTAVMSMGVYLCLEEIPVAARRWGAGAATGNELFANSLLCGMVLLPATIFIGGTYPFAVRILAGSVADAGAAAARVYSWNTVGSVCGAVLSGFWIVPALGFEGTIWLMVALSFLLAIAGSLLSIETRLQWKASLACVCLLALAAFWPQAPERILSSSPLVADSYQGDVIFQAVGRSSTVRLTDVNGYYRLQNNGLPEALIGMKGSPPFRGELHRWLTGLPLVARPDADSILVIGLGGGVAVDRVPKSVHEIDVIELEPEVVAANRHIARRRQHDPLADPRVNIVVNDARGALSLSDRNYDIIVSQPSHPWTAGASHLYTREFLHLAKRHLASGGVFLQWLNTDFLDESLFKTMGATLLSEYEHVRLYQPTATALFFLASNSPLRPEEDLVMTGEPLKSHYAEFSRLPITTVNDLLGILSLDETGLRQLCRGAPINSDNRNRLAFQSAPNKNRDDGVALRRLFRPVDPLLNRASSLYANPHVVEAIHPGLIVRRMCTIGTFERADAYAESFTDPAQQQFAKAVIARSMGDSEKTKRFLQGALSADPGLNEARFLLCEQFANEFLAGRVPESVQQVYDELHSPEREVFNALLAVQNSDFAKIAALEPQLAAVPRDNLAFVFSLYQRAAWRAAPHNDPRAWLHAKQALELVDQAMSTWNLNQGYLMRINAARMADEPDKVVETARHYALQLAEDAQSQRVAQQARPHLSLLQQIVQRTAPDPRLETEVVKRIHDTIQGIARGMGPHVTPERRTILPVQFERRVRE